MVVLLFVDVILCLSYLGGADSECSVTTLPCKGFNLEALIDPSRAVAFDELDGIRDRNLGRQREQSYPSINLLPCCGSYRR